MAQRNAQQTTKQLILAAKKGDAEAQFNLGNMYHDGEGVPQDYDQALKYFRLAAEQGVASAQYNLGLMYGKGEGVQMSKADCMIWLEEAANQGHATSMITLGKLYGNLATSKIEGYFFNSSKNFFPDAMVNCLKWFYLAGIHGVDNAEELIKIACSTATKEEIAQAQELARNWKPKK